MTKFEKSSINKRLNKVYPTYNKEVKIAIIGNAPDEDSARVGIPFQGEVGTILDELLEIVGIDRAECYIGNVFLERPPMNQLSYFYHKTGIKPEWEHEVERLKSDLEQLRPNIVVALGPDVLRLLTGIKGLGKNRGTVLESTLVPGMKVMCTYHPAIIQKQWQYRSTAGKDFMKVKIESQSAAITRPNRELWIKPTIADLYEFEAKHMTGSELMAIDIETSYPFKDIKQILCVGFAPSPNYAIVVPFVDKTKKSWNYWKTAEQEYEAVEWVRRHCESDVTKVGQNFLYDVQWLDRKLGIKVGGRVDDTMLMAHALQPELEKSLGYLSSIYTNEAAFKNMVSFTQNKGEN